MMSVPKNEVDEKTCHYKLLVECRDISYFGRLKYLRLHFVKGGRVSRGPIHIFKIFYGCAGIDVHAFFSSPQTNITRNLEEKVFIKCCITTKCKCYFSQSCC